MKLIVVRKWENTEGIHTNRSQWENQAMRDLEEKIPSYKNIHNLKKKY